MWPLHLLLHEWLSGSLLLPLMLLVLWGASMWKRLNWLTRSGKGWLKFWGCYGLLKENAVGIVIFVVTFVREPGARDALGPAARAVLWRFNLGYSPIVGLLAIALGAIFEAAVDCGLAAIIWWLFQWISEQRRGIRRSTAM